MRCKSEIYHSQPVSRTTPEARSPAMKVGGGGGGGGWGGGGGGGLGRVDDT